MRKIACPVFPANHHTECDCYYEAVTVIFRTMLGPRRPTTTHSFSPPRLLSLRRLSRSRHRALTSTTFPCCLFRSRLLARDACHPRSFSQHAPRQYFATSDEWHPAALGTRVALKPHSVRRDEPNAKHFSQDESRIIAIAHDVSRGRHPLLYLLAGRSGWFPSFIAHQGELR